MKKINHRYHAYFRHLYWQIKIMDTVRGGVSRARTVPTSLLTAPVNSLTVTKSVLAAISKISAGTIIAIAITMPKIIVDSPGFY